MKLFNIEGSDNKAERKIVSGNTTNLINLNNVRYDWAIQMWRQMRSNFWIAEKVDLSLDINDYKNLTKEETRAFDGILSYLIFLDSVQVSSVPNFIRYVTAPEIKLCLAEQESQEGLHGQSYQYIIETVIPFEKRDYIYSLWKTDTVLKQRIEFITKELQAFIDNPTEVTFLKALIADYVLEGLYFYQGFVFFYNLASRSLCGGVADIFKYINIDELAHVRLYQYMINEVSQDIPLDKNWIAKLFFDATNNEIEWAKHIIGNNVLGITYSSIENYSCYLANLRLKAIGCDPIFDNPKNPYKHLEKIADVKDEASVKTNFFDATVTTYQNSSTLSGWQDF